MMTRTSLRQVALRLFADSSGRAATLGRSQLDSGAASLRQTNGDRLLRRAGAVLTLTDMVHFFADELARLR